MKTSDIEPFFATLKAANPMPNTELEYTTPFELLAAVLLTACSSTPLPPWPSTPTTRPGAPAPLPQRPQQGTVVPAPLGQAPQVLSAPQQGVVTRPL